MDPFTCAHCSHRADLHSTSVRRLSALEADSFGVADLWGPEVRTCHYPGCACVYAPVPHTSPAGIDPDPKAYLLGSDVPNHADLERWEAELA